MPSALWEWEAVPRYRRQSQAQVKASVLAASLALLLEGKRVSAITLREYGCRGASDRLTQMRDALVDAGELPVEAAPRAYTRRPAPEPQPKEDSARPSGARSDE